MCGRFTLVADESEVFETFSVERVDYEYSPRYNVAPSQTIAAIAHWDGERVLTGYRWGLIPFWAKDAKIGYKMINARAETIESKPAFRNLLSRNRVVIPSDGFYEWKKAGDDKQPFRFQLESKKVFGFAGLFDTWEHPENGEMIRSCTIITTEPNQLVQDVHDRMPVILNSEGVNMWLDPKVTDKHVLQDLLVPYPAEQMILYPVSKMVGNVKNNQASLVDEIPMNSR
ncbi:SOS response-associated peptidase [Paenibacillus jiagnxiensis]|uniref:SOS response-associated peptidase n=1 Tax=Paenibacillus jiagnxiensis TaxID=3228926 RepID=UPI0034716590